MEKLNSSLINQIQNDLYYALGVKPSNDGVKVWFQPGQNGPMSFCSSFDIHFDFDKIVNFVYDIDYIEDRLSPVIKKYGLTDYWEPGAVCSLHVHKDMDPYVEPGFDYDNDPYLKSINEPQNTKTDTNPDKRTVTIPVTKDIPASLDIEGPVNFAERSPMRTNCVHNSSLNPFAKATCFGLKTGLAVGTGMFVYEKIKEDEDHPVSYKKVIVGALLTAGVAGCISYYLNK